MLTLQFIPHSNIANLSSEERIKKLIGIVKDEKIILLEGRLREEEETELIKKTMEAITEKFTGIELGVIYPRGKDTTLYKRLQILIRSNYLLKKRQESVKRNKNATPMC